MVVESLNQLEKNVSASFGYVKKDLLMLNDAISDMNDKIQHLSLNHAALLEKLEEINTRLKSKKVTKKVVKKPTKKAVKKKVTKKNDNKELDFYDVKSKKRFRSNVYNYETRSGRTFAVANAPSGIKSWRIVSSPKSVSKKVTNKTNTPKRIVKETIEY
jgi:regulator of replication initiation timing